MPVSSISPPLSILTRSSLSSEPVRVPVYAKRNGVVVNPTSMTAQMAFKTAGNNPTGGDYVSGSWDTDNTTSTPTYSVIATPPVLSVGVYYIWVKLTGTDVPVKKVGILQIV